MSERYSYYSERWGSIAPTDSEMLRYWVYEVAWFFGVWLTLMFALTSAAIAWQVNVPLGSAAALLFGATTIWVMRKVNGRLRRGRGAIAKVTAFRGLIAPKAQNNTSAPSPNGIQTPAGKKAKAR